MTIDEAIRVLGVLAEAPVIKDQEKAVKGLNLGIEALKEIKNLRETRISKFHTLPGETESQ